jgi:hypothetical protein
MLIMKNIIEHMVLFKKIEVSFYVPLTDLQFLETALRRGFWGHRTGANSLFVWLVADDWCWFVLKEKYCWLVVYG